MFAIYASFALKETLAKGVNMEEKKNVRLVMIIPEEKRREIKSFAGEHGKTMTEILIEAFNLLKAKTQHP